MVMRGNPKHRGAGILRGRVALSPTVWAHICWHKSILHLYGIRVSYFIFRRKNMSKKVGIIMGSDSDLPIIKKATDMLKSLDIPFEVHIYSAHRTPVEAADFAKSAKANGFGALICAAGMAAHLAGAIAANTVLPVIGIPCKSSNLDGLDALLSTVMMPTGIPVATVAIDGGGNAALLAAQILANEDDALYDRLVAKRASDAKKVLEKDAKVMEQL